MTAILSCRAMLNQRPLRRGCLIEFLYPTVCPLSIVSALLNQMPRLQCMTDSSGPGSAGRSARLGGCDAHRATAAEPLLPLLTRGGPESIVQPWLTNAP
jgi:hypothetical protein